MDKLTCMVHDDTLEMNYKGESAPIISQALQHKMEEDVEAILFGKPSKTKAA